MKTLKQIMEKEKTLRERLKYKKMRENFGDNEIRKLGDFIGDVYLYPYSERLTIIGIQNSFAFWCETYTGKGE